ncbi:MAG TPA: DUF5667 domain-containing protein [Actinomycetota bacterium]
MRHTIAEVQLALAHALDDAALTPSGEIRGLVRLARVLQAVPDPEVDPDFAARLEARLLTEGLDELSVRRIPATSPPPKAHVSPRRSTAASIETPIAEVVALPRGRFVVRKAVVGFVAAAMLFALPVVSAGSALPGSPLYGVKMAKEQIELAMARGPVADGFVYLRHAQRRLGEAEQLIATGRDRLVPSTLRRYDDAIQTGTQLILSATTDPAALARLAAQIRFGTGSLARLLDAASADVTPSVIDAIATADEMSLRVAIALGAAAETVAPGVAVLDGVAAEGPAAPAEPDALGQTTGVAPIPGSPPVAPDDPSVPGGEEPGDGKSPGSRGATPSCLGTLVPDPANAGRTVCAVAESIQEHGSRDEPAPSASQVAGCPSASTCGIYALDRHRWSISGGVATLSFVVNPVQPWVSPSEAVAAAVSAARTWSSANPNVRVDYRGTTSSLPTLGDGINQIGWGNPGGANSLAQANLLRVGDRVVEADIVLTVTQPWATTHGGAINRYDIEAVLVHEIGHWLGLDHLHDGAAAEQSMFVRPRAGDASGATLALGDVKAVRAAYPCGSCPMPRIAADEVADERATAPGKKTTQAKG